LKKEKQETGSPTRDRNIGEVGKKENVGGESVQQDRKGGDPIHSKGYKEKRAL